MTKKRGLIGLTIFLVLAWIALEVVSDRVGASFNRTRDPGPYQVSEEALATNVDACDAWARPATT